MKISYGITVKDEIVEIQHLLTFLLKNKRQQDEIVILFDSINGSSSVEDYLRANSINDDCGFKWYPYPFNGHFADLKNYLNSWCTGNYIFQIDADETPDEELMKQLPNVLAIGTPNLAPGLEIRKSQQLAIAKPPPTAIPSITAILGMGKVAKGER